MSEGRREFECKCVCVALAGKQLRCQGKGRGESGAGDVGVTIGRSAWLAGPREVECRQEGWGTRLLHTQEMGTTHMKRAKSGHQIAYHKDNYYRSMDT